MRCKVGDLAVIVRSVADNQGKLVEVMGFMGSEPMFDGFIWHYAEHQCWMVRSVGSPLNSLDGKRRTTAPMPDSFLRPIRPDADPESITTDEVLEVGA